MNRQPTVLYVEDDPLSQEVMQIILGHVMGLPHVTIFADSADFLQRVSALIPRPEIILLDIHIEPHNGFEMLRMLRSASEFRNLPVIALTASVMNEEIEQLRQAGFDAVIAKPVDIDTFPGFLDKALTNANLWYMLD